MKISSPTLTTPDTLTYGRVSRGGAGTAAPLGAGRAASLSTSDFLTELQGAVRADAYGEVRSHKVAEARADIDAGRLGTEDDFENAVNALLREL